MNSETISTSIRMTPILERLSEEVQSRNPQLSNFSETVCFSMERLAQAIRAQPEFDFEWIMKTPLQQYEPCEKKTPSGNRSINLPQAAYNYIKEAFSQYTGGLSKRPRVAFLIELALRYSCVAAAPPELVNEEEIINGIHLVEELCRLLRRSSESPQAKEKVKKIESILLKEE